ncbi:MAG: hypothetical protein V1678_05250 [Candidatus Aenigmatarchaeota archaeon]
MAKRGKEEEDLNNKVVLILAIVVVLIVATSTWLVLNKLTGIDVKQPQPKTVTITKVVEMSPPTGSVVGLTILPQPKEDM